jgi:spermidine synthase
MLEIGCGRGGGAEYMMRYLKPDSLVGVDLSESIITLCRKMYALVGLTFETGDAEADLRGSLVVDYPSHGRGLIDLDSFKKALSPAGKIAF